MKIGISTFGTDGKKSGIGQYLQHILDQFSVFNSFDGEILECRGLHEYSRGLSNFSNYNISPVFKNPILNIVWHQIVLPKVCKNRKYDVLFLPAANRRIPYRVSCPVVGTVHDFSSFHISGKYDPFRELYIKYVLPKLVKELDHVITISQSSKTDILNITGIEESKITVIPQGIDHKNYFPRDKEESQEIIIRKYGIKPPYLLYVSRIEHPGKNHINLIRAFEDLKRTEKIPHSLVLAGSDWSRSQEVHQVANQSDYNSNIIFPGFIERNDLPILYNACDVFVFPSLYEGFGIPVIEAMACGIPVACSNSSSLPEIAGNAAILFDPYSKTEIKKSISKLLCNGSLHAQFSQRGVENSKKYSWERTALRTFRTILSSTKGGALCMNNQLS